tara:strand:- start:337 stop:1047 length:711 start_codon:yes stop_codon:yes gene_type:complete
MQIKTKLVILELIAGICGWGWIIAGAVALYYFVMAIGFDGTWTPFFWAFGAGAVAKWLAKGFQENKQRIALENQPASETPHDNRQKAEQRVKVISDYGQFLEHNPTAGEIRDATDLPHPKEEILDAICLELVREGDDNRREALKVGALTLAYFQAGVGTEPLSMLGVSVDEMANPPESDDALRALAARMANNPNRERYETFEALADEESTTIQAKLAAAEQLRQQMPEDKKREILG